MISKSFNQYGIYKPSQLRTYIKALKKFSNNKNGLINPINENNEYIIWCHLVNLLTGKYLELVRKEQQQKKRVSKYNRYVIRVDYTIIESRVTMKVIKKSKDKIILNSIENNCLRLSNQRF